MWKAPVFVYLPAAAGICVWTVGIKARTDGYSTKRVMEEIDKLQSVSMGNTVNEKNVFEEE